MIRKRDFALFLCTVMGLMIAIGATYVLTAPGREMKTAWLPPAPPPIATSATTTVARTEPDRAARLAALREKLAARNLVAETPSPSALGTATTAGPSTESSTTTPAVAGASTTAAAVAQCPDYSPWSGFWDASGISLAEVEGARLVYREALVASAVASTSAGTQIPPGAVLAELPLRTLPNPTPSCLPSDVIGIATDGSLIRNDEVGLYGIFGPETLVGYALDGFPIYGMDSTAATDECGGAVLGDSYRYVLSSERAVILNCFAGAPITL